jgi:CHAT domain-containing protein/Tfp pilus assembly protein PilF
MSYSKAGVRHRATKGLTISVHCALIALFVVPLSAQIAGRTRLATSPTTLDKGIFVEWLTEDGEAKRSGMRAGDVLLSWSSATKKGEVESPFDVPFVGFEQGTQGVVKLEGLRGSQRRTWFLHKIPWGIAARPNITGPVLSAYLQAESFAHSGRLTESVDNWRKAATMVQSSGPPWLSVWFLSHAGDALFRAKQMEASDDLYRDAIQSASELSPIIKGDLFRQWATQLEARAEIGRAEKYYEQELNQWKLLNAETLIAKSLSGLGTLLSEKGDFKNAESDLLQASSIFERLQPTSIQRAVNHNNLGVLYQDQGDLRKAEKHYRIALAIEREYFAGTRQLANTLTDLGTLALWRGSVTAAEQYHREALAIAKKLKLPLDTADILDNISDCRLERGDLAVAETDQKQALSIREQLGATGSVASSLASLGKIARLGGRLDAAGDYYRRALEIARKLDPPPPGRAIFLAGSGDVLRDRGNLLEAEKMYRQALALMEQVAPRSLDHAETLVSLAATLRGQKRLQEAAESYRQALDDLDYQTASVGAGEETQARYRAKHGDYYRQYVDLLIEEGQTVLAFQTLESSRARTLLEMLTHAQIDIRQGVDPALLARERELRQSLNAKSQYRVRLLTAKHTDEQLRSLDRDISVIEDNYQQVKASIRTSSPAYAALSQPRPASLKEIQQLLNTDTMLLEYSLGVEHSYVWAVTENSLKAYELPDRATIEKIARRVYNLLTARNGILVHATEGQMEEFWRQTEKEYPKVAAELSHMVLGPVRSLIAGKRLLIVSDGALQYIPFAALPEPTTNRPGKPLILNHEIINLPSASVLAELRRQSATRASPPKSVAVLADPVFNAQDRRVSNYTTIAIVPRGTQNTDSSLNRLTRSAADVSNRKATRTGEFRFERLLYTRKEADAILSVTPTGTAMKALDFQANRATALSPALAQYRVVHFATHGLLDSKHPELSGLVLSLVNKQGKPQDGFLELQDIYNMNLPVDLVVLSGCKTGLGEEINGEGLIGLTRGFMYAGASRVMASLWGVSDWATSELMERFYRAMEQQHMRPAAALRTAQIQMWKQNTWKSPYYWAAFQIQGEWR